ncbi:uncharacterized protein LOC118348652 [Juglans regia]|uniref:Uncharacterized protein LOC118348652 n=1 Tax=Juglans regia TaxID=51240 RepID=A0A6P9EVL4_JUGRE|nr:uncharacterized protein LOC118348652 [Juglans regia]
MDKAWMHIEDRLRSNEYGQGVRQFMAMAQANAPSSDRIRCPCRRCRNRQFHPLSLVEDHLFIIGIDSTYTEWIFHGEDDPFHHATFSDDEPDHASADNDYIDDVDEMLEDIRVGSFVDNSSRTDADADANDDIDSYNPPTNLTFNELVADARQPLYPSCAKFSRLSFIVKLLHIKTIGGWTVKSFDMVIKLLQAAFLDALFPDSYNDARRLQCGLGFSYEKIHVCPNDCALFWKENAEYNQCPKCNASRWVSSSSVQQKIPQKVLRYFPLKSRLQRLFLSKKTAQAMRWHVEERVDDPTCMSHPADSRVWKDFDHKHGWFSQDFRHVRLGLASDGFNPFNNMSKPYSIWPALGNDIDVFLRPLVDELRELWEDAYANLSGWSTKGKMACPVCTAETDSKWLVYGRKHCYMGHRRWLVPDHNWRRKKSAFNGCDEHRLQPSRVAREDLLEQLLGVSHVIFGKSSSKRKRTPNQLNWTKKSIFFDLPYWLDLRLKHNLDVMHIEKNICDNVLGTLLNIEGKTKDSANARRDLENIGIRKELHLVHDGDRISMSLACYMLNLNERRNFCAWLSVVKFPDGFASNIGRCVNVSEGKIKGMKSHDCHIFMQALLPVVIGGLLQPNVRQALIDLSSFFKELCSRTLTLSVLHRLQANIPIILCKLEMIFPPAFFDIMVHLAIHLPEEALLAGPVQYRWMYPFERYLGKFKRYVRNRACPEGSITEAYVHLEYITERNATMMVLCLRLRQGMSQVYLFSRKREHYNKMKEEDQNNIDRRHQSQFPAWFRSRIRELRAVSPSEVTNDIYALACGPDPWVASYAGCIMNGVRFHTKERKRHRRTQNNGVVVHGEHQGSPTDFYGVLHDIIELRYMGWLKVYLFSCAWYDVGDLRRGIRYMDHLTLVNTARQWYKDEPFALACQALQVFYLTDPTLGESWQVVQKTTNRNVYNIRLMTTVEEDPVDESSGGEADDEVHTNVVNYPPIIESEYGMSDPLHRVDEEHLPVDPSIISHRHSSQLVDDEEFIDDDPLDDVLGMDDINDDDTSGSESEPHLHDEETDDDDGIIDFLNFIFIKA